MAKIITDPKKIDELLTRGVEEVIVKDHLREALFSGKQLRVKLGIDPTSPAIHLGRAVVLRKLRAFQELGHLVIFIVGDFTGVIGDTSDKESERPMLTEAEIEKNMKTYFSQAFKILDEKKTEVHYNSEWLSKLGFHEVAKLADLFGLHEFEARENVARRMKAGKRVSLREVLYPLMQGYDSVAIKADVEIGGTDQKFNMLSGRVIQPTYNLKPQDIITMQLLEGTDGRKMSSSWGNVIKITDEANEMFGKIMSVGDDFIRKYFLLATDLPQSEIEEVMELSPRDAKLKLGEEIVALYHGKKAGNGAREEFIKVFSEKAKPDEIPTVKISEKELSLADLLVAAKLVKSKSEARRLIEQGGVKVNDEKKTDPNELIQTHGALIQVGPRRFVRVISVLFPLLLDK